MRIAHLSDLHLGYAAYTRVTPRGENQRTADVMDTFRRAVDAVVALKPDLILIAGDVFHVSAPQYSAAHAACGEFRRLSAVAPTVVVQGNHDEPKEYTRGSALALLRHHGVHVVLHAERLTFGDVSILAVPESAAESTAFAPEGESMYNVLLLHAAIKNTQQGYGVLEPEQLNAERWSYIACGDFHTHRRVTDNGWYSGSLDYVSSDPWREARSGIAKGFVVHNLATGAHEFHEIPTRAFHDLPAIEARGLSPAEIDAAIQANASAVAIEGAVVRQVVRDVSTSTVRVLDNKAIRALRGAALHYQLDTRKPAEERMRAESFQPDDYYEGPLFPEMDDEVTVGTEETDPLLAACYGHGELPAEVIAHAAYIDAAWNQIQEDAA